MTEPQSAQAAPQDVRTPPPRRRRRWPWVVALLLVASAAGLRALLPVAVERGTAWGSREYLGLPARIDDVSFDLLHGRVVLDGVSIAARPDDVTPRDAALRPPPIDPAAALVHVDRISAQLVWKDLRDRTLHLRELQVEAPAVRLTPESDGRIDPLRHARPAAPTSPAEPPPPPAPDAPPPWKIALDAFGLKAPDVRVLDPKGGEDLLEFALQDFALTGVAVQGTEFTLGGLDIGGPVLRVRRDLVLAAQSGTAPTPAPSAAAPPPPPAAAPAPAGPKPGYHVAKIDIQRAAFTWITDRGPLDVTLALHASDVSADPGKRFPLDLQLEIGDGRMRIAGDVGIVPPTYAGKLEWSGMPIPRLLLVSVPQFATWLRAAMSSGDLQIEADPTGANGAAAMRVSGRLAFDALAVSDPKGTEVTLGWQRLEVGMREVYAPIPQPGQPLATTRAALDRIVLVEPKIRYTRPSPQLDALLGIDLSGAGVASAKPEAKKPVAEKPVVVGPPGKAGSASAAPIELSIASLQMKGGEIEAIDKAVKPVARTRIGALALEAQDVRFPPPAAKAIHLDATLPKTAKLELRGELAAGNAGRFTLKLRKLDLPTFNPYAGLAAGVTVDKGTASVDTKLAMRGARMDVDTRLVLNQFGVSMRDPETFERSFGVPIDLALALLRDPNGDIALHIPVTIDEKGAKIGMGAVIGSAIKAALVGAITAPLKMVGALFGGGEGAGGFSIDPLPSVAGSPDLEGDPGARLDGLVQMLGERPMVGLSLRGRVGPEDRPLVAQQILVEQWSAGQGLPEIEDASFLARRRIGQALSKRAKGESVQLDAEDQALFDRYVAAIAVPDARLAALARARAERVRALLIEKGVAAPRVAIGEPEAESKPGVVIGLKAG